MAHLNGEIIQGVLDVGLEAGPQVQLAHKERLHHLLDLHTPYNDE